MHSYLVSVKFTPPPFEKTLQRDALRRILLPTLWAINAVLRSIMSRAFDTESKSAFRRLRIDKPKRWGPSARRHRPITRSSELRQPAWSCEFKRLWFLVRAGFKPKSFRSALGRLSLSQLSYNQAAVYLLRVQVNRINLWRKRKTRSTSFVVHWAR